MQIDSLLNRGEMDVMNRIQEIVKGNRKLFIIVMIFMAFQQVVFYFPMVPLNIKIDGQFVGYSLVLGVLGYMIWECDYKKVIFSLLLANVVGITYRYVLGWNILSEAGSIQIANILWNIVINLVSIGIVYYTWRKVSNRKR